MQVTARPRDRANLVGARAPELRARLEKKPDRATRHATAAMPRAAALLAEREEGWGGEAPLEEDSPARATTAARIGSGRPCDDGQPRNRARMSTVF